MGNLTLIIFLNRKCKYKYRASASVKSKIRASNDLIRETICELNLRAMIVIETSTNCHASTSVKSEIHASNNLIRETICKLNSQVMVTTMKQQK